MGSAYITWLLLLIHYLVVYDLDEESRDLIEDGEYVTQNVVDQRVLGWVARRFKRHVNKWETPIDKVINPWGNVELSRALLTIAIIDGYAPERPAVVDRSGATHRWLCTAGARN